MSQQRYATTLDGHHVCLTFDTGLVVLNRASLEVDGEQVDSARIFYGEKDLSTELADGTTIRVRVHSGMVGELTRAQAQTGDGEWRDLAPS